MCDKKTFQKIRNLRISQSFLSDERKGIKNHGGMGSFIRAPQENKYLFGDKVLDFCINGILILLIVGLIFNFFIFPVKADNLIDLRIIDKGSNYIVWGFNSSDNITEVYINGENISFIKYSGIIDKTGLDIDTSYMITMYSNTSNSSLITQTDKDSMTEILEFLDKIKFEILGIALIIIAILLSPFVGLITFCICLIDGSLFISNNEPIYGILAYFVAMGGILVFKFRGEK